MSKAVELSARKTDGDEGSGGSGAVPEGGVEDDARCENDGRSSGVNIELLDVEGAALSDAGRVELTMTVEFVSETIHVPCQFNSIQLVTNHHGSRSQGSPLPSLLRWLLRHIKRSLAGSADTIARKSQTIKANVRCILSLALTRAQETFEDGRQWSESVQIGRTRVVRAGEVLYAQGGLHSICTQTELLPLRASVDQIWLDTQCMRRLLG